jgi:hypothetical protein
MIWVMMMMMMMMMIRYANRAKNIKNKPKINEDPKDAMLREYQEQVSDDEDDDVMYDDADYSDGDGDDDDDDDYSDGDGDNDAIHSCIDSCNGMAWQSCWL